MKSTITIIASLLVLLSGCSVQTQTRGSASIPNAEYNKVYALTTQAILDSEFSITSSDKETGIIVAKAGRNLLLAHEGSSINIIVLKSGEGVNLDIRSTLAGQVADYGINEDNIKSFCKNLKNLLPEATCEIKP